jgi:hypothetical protein
MYDPIEMSSAIIKLMELTKNAAPEKMNKITLAVRPGEDFAVCSFRAENGSETIGGTEHGGDYSEIISVVKRIREMYKDILPWNTMAFTVKDGCPFPQFDSCHAMSNIPLPKEEILEWAKEEHKKAYGDDENNENNENNDNDEPKSYKEIIKARIISLIENNPEMIEDDFFDNSASDEEIAEAEEALGVKFPEAYVWFLKEGKNAYELIGSPESCVRETLSKRETGMPPNLVMVEDNGEYITCIDTETTGIVGFWEPCEEDYFRECYSDFYEYYEEFLENAIGGSFEQIGLTG